MSAPLIVSIDVEDWPQSTWDHNLPVTERAARNTERLLDLLSAHSNTVTMFILGKFAEQFPDVVRRIANEGHEIASHGYGHIEVFKQTPDEFRQDIQRSKALLEDLTGQAVQGYRAPDYSITNDTLWALDILAELGFVYDSSIFPSSITRYGIPEWTPDPALVQLPDGKSIIELPLSTISYFNRRLPVAGGGYHRLLPWSIIRQAINHRLKQNQPFVAYCHPYEFDPKELEEIDIDIPLKTRLHQGLGRQGFQRKFELMLTTFDCQHAINFVTNREFQKFTIPNSRTKVNI